MNPHRLGWGGAFISDLVPLISMVTKKVFMQRPSIRNLPAEAKESRWLQHVASSRKQPARVSQNKNRQVVVSPTRTVPSKKNLMSKCAFEYAHALANPFDGPLACTPKTPSVYSLKTRNFVRGSGSTGTNSFGYVIADPFDPTNDGDPVSLTDALFTGTGATLFALSGTGITTANTNSLFTLSDIGSSLENRIVAAGIRVRYTGTELNMGGIIVPYSDTLTNAVNGDSFNTLLTRDPVQAPIQDFNRSWTTCVYTPADVAQTDFTAGAINVHTMVIAVNSAAITQPFEWEFFNIIEYKGASARGATKTDVDPTGYATALDFIRDPTVLTAISKGANMTQNYVYSLMSRYVIDHAKAMIAY